MAQAMAKCVRHTAAAAPEASNQSNVPCVDKKMNQNTPIVLHKAKKRKKK